MQNDGLKLPVIHHSAFCIKLSIVCSQQIERRFAVFTRREILCGGHVAVERAGHAVDEQRLSLAQIRPNGCLGEMKAVAKRIRGIILRPGQVSLFANLRNVCTKRYVILQGGATYVKGQVSFILHIWIAHYSCECLRGAVSISATMRSGARRRAD